MMLGPAWVSWVGVLDPGGPRPRAFQEALKRCRGLGQQFGMSSGWAELWNWGSCVPFLATPFLSTKVWFS